MTDLLFLAHRLPYPPNKGDKLRSYHLLRHLSQHYRVHLGCFVDDRADRKYFDRVAAMCYETCFIEHSALGARLRSLRGLATGEALSLPYYRSARLDRWVARIMATRELAGALAFSSPMAQYLLAARGLRRIVDFVDVDSEKWRCYANDHHWPLSALYQREAKRLLAFERAAAAQCEYTTFVSRDEAGLFARLAPECRARIGSFSNGVDSDYFSPHIVHRNPYPTDCNALVFTGAMDYWPNIDAVDWFAHHVFRELHAMAPQLRFYIVGARPVPQVRALARLAGVVVSGTVPDTRPYLAHAALAVAPLRIARGIQNKVLEAMAMQKLVIVSPDAMTGISACEGTELLVARNAAEYARQIRAALGAPETRKIGLAARARILKDYDWDRNLAHLSRTMAAPSGAGAALP